MVSIAPKFRPVGTRPDYEVVPFYPSDHFEKRITQSRRKDDGLPENLTWFGAQIAGHKTQVKDGKQQLGFIKDLDFPERILKPVMPDKRGKIEKTFYTSIFASSSPALAPYRNLLPQFHGVREISYKGTTHELLDMEDISEFFVLPAVIDIKVGQRTYGPDANEEKRRKETEKYPQQEEIGFRILGYKIESGETMKVASRDREYCLTLETDHIEGALREFLAFRGPDVHVIIDELLDQLETVRDAASLGVYHIFSSSLLIAYEADREAAPRAEIRWIDFSHVFPGNGQPDVNYLYGVNRLVEYLKSIRLDLR
ncbi:hypothetical protein PRIPAC_95698 [Pristionchus pacificus]|uniref:Kinase n=1 Tax=Pristionchus pacificus TaxID=54126 RepID=A0A2A6D0I6_PRIPA|nr:hypothetical protein PRIPAC_95698 [Pristionchus pacificus]|eukprot:PDM83915.1 hypothetical protein PRIPAC_34107 [Pristionchus pacificus]